MGTRVWLSRERDDRGSFRSSINPGPWPRIAFWTFVAWAIIPAIWGLGWCLRLITPGHKTAAYIDQWAMANFYSHSLMFWSWIWLGVLATMIIVIACAVANRSTRRSNGHGIAATIVTLLAFVGLVLTSIQWGHVAFEQSTGTVGLYGQYTTIYATDEANTQSLAFILVCLLAALALLVVIMGV